MSWWRWLGTTTGRTVLQGAAVVTSLGTFAGYFVPNTLLLTKYKEFVQSYERGLGQPVAENIKNLYEQACADLEVTKREASQIEVFTVYGFDLFHAGSTVLRTGAILGVPVNFSYDSEKDINRNIKVVNKTIDWESEAGTILKESLVLSEDARKFALAREVCSAMSSSVWWYCGYPSGAVLLTYMLSKTLNDKFATRNHPFRFIMYSLVASFMFTLNLTLTDLTTAYLENAQDERAAEINANYAEGGVEFYQKLQLRNQALRTLMGEAGEKLYTVTGNHVMFIRQKNLPLSERLRTVQGIRQAKSTDVQVTSSE